MKIGKRIAVLGAAAVLAAVEGGGTGSGRSWDGVAAWAGVVYFDGGGTGLRVGESCKSGERFRFFYGFHPFF